MLEAQDLIFLDEECAREFIEKFRWPGGLRCIRCGSQRITRMGGRTQAGMLLCRECRHKFTCRVGTAMEHSHVPLHKWLHALRTVTTGDRRLSPQRLRRELGLGSYRTAWLMAHRIREALSRYRRGSGLRVQSVATGSAAEKRGEQKAAVPELTFDEVAHAVIVFGAGREAPGGKLKAERSLLDRPGLHVLQHPNRHSGNRNDEVSGWSGGTDAP